MAMPIREGGPDVPPMRRLSRTLGWDRNPLRRRIDRVEAFIFAALIGTFLVSAPLVVIMAGRAVLAETSIVRRAEEGWRQVTAVVERPPAVPAAEFAGTFPSATILARWTAPDGRRCWGWLSATSMTQPGSRVQVWVDRSGTLTGRPVSTALLHVLSTVAEACAPAVLALVLYATGRAVRCVLDLRRFTGWERAWQAVGPRWSQRR